MASKNDAEFSERLRQALDFREMNQRDLIRALAPLVAPNKPPSPATVSAWFKAGVIPGGELLIHLPRALRVSPRWLVTGAGHPSEIEVDASDPYREGAASALDEVRAAVESIRERMVTRGRGAKELAAERRARKATARGAKNPRRKAQ